MGCSHPCGSPGRSTAGRKRSTRSSPSSASTRSTPTASGCSRPFSTSQDCRPRPSSSGEHAALHLVAPSGDAVTKLLGFWRQRTDTGRLVYDFTDSSLSTRFLGDLYQDLSAYAKSTFALLQTPVFVEEFILDRTLVPALDERPLEGFRMIDPTCGSGHFLLGAFERLLDRFQKHAPATETQALVQQALNAVHGVDLNPFAVAIARFRLTVAAMSACSLGSLESAPAFRFHLAVGDSLLHGPGQQTLHGDAELSGFAYATEDLEVLQTILAGGRYDVVVGNPPYIQVGDRTLSLAYRQRFSTCKGQYALTVPFMERFFTLARQGLPGQPAGWIGQITSNSFMKREFGSKLIEEFLVLKDLRFVIDSEGAWIPGHNTDGTPTVILIAQNRPPLGHCVRAVLSKGKRETRVEGDSGKGPYWSSLVANLENPGWEDEWVSIADLDRSLLATHPWSLGGGGAVEVRAALEKASRRRLSSELTDFGFLCVTREDSAFLLGADFARRHSIGGSWVAQFVAGDGLRDWRIVQSEVALCTHGEGSPSSQVLKALWPNKKLLNIRKSLSGTQEERGLPWHHYSAYTERRVKAPVGILFPLVASHPHFVRRRGFELATQGVTMLALRSPSADVCAGLLGVLNSSTACFWLKQNSQPKGGAAEHLWSRTYEFTGTTVQDFPLPTVLPEARGRRLDFLAQKLAELSPESVAARHVPTFQGFAAEQAESILLLRTMTALQEELDWEVYTLFGLIPENFTYDDAICPV